MVTRLNGSRFAVNPDLVARLHASPDTTLVMVDGVSYVVTETVDEVIDEIVAFRARVIAMARRIEESAPTGPVPLTVVPALPKAEDER